MTKYEDRKVIPFEEKIITENYIEVTIPSTRFIRREKQELVTLDEIMEKLKKIRKLAKEKGVKVKGINKLSKKIKDNYSEYESEALLAQSKFEELRKGWSSHVIREGYSDDVYYKETLRRLEFELQRMNHLNKPLGMFRTWLTRINKAIDQLENDDGLTMIGF